ncbi:unnamed protein product [Arabis nemorensis]|uniref:Uncharacterized protein n=1 Tax=Arabis nemorensis TaxID=586526 RepID=A0A565BVL0_9BRAS|nr:unnamed protein product [Arabis nemorensis]
MEASVVDLVWSGHVTVACGEDFVEHIKRWFTCLMDARVVLAFQISRFRFRLCSSCWCG